MASLKRPLAIKAVPSSRELNHARAPRLAEEGKSGKKCQNGEEKLERGNKPGPSTSCFFDTRPLSPPLPGDRSFAPDRFLMAPGPESGPRDAEIEEQVLLS